MAKHARNSPKGRDVFKTPDHSASEHDAMAFRSPSEKNLRQLEAAHTWHPFAQMREFLSYPPLFIERAKGLHVYDTHGRRYLDANSSLWTNVHGHNDNALNAALIRQLKKAAHTTWLGLSHPPASELAAALIKEAPKKLARVFFSDNGAGAIEIAIKQSWQYWMQTGFSQKQEIIGLTHGYHGDTLLCMAAGDSGDFHGKFKKFFPPAWHCPRPENASAAQTRKSLGALERHLKAHAKKTACLVMEPLLQGSAGMYFHSPAFVRGVARLCRQYRVHLILDEVFTAFGRMGQVCVCKQLGVTPDFLCLAKGLGGGYLPIAATLTSEDIYEAFLGRLEDGNAFIHGHTFTANPLACAVALESLKKLKKLIAHGTLKARIKSFHKHFKAAFKNHPHVAAMRYGGLAAAVDLVPDAKRPHKKYPLGARAGLQVCLEARKRGLILRPLGDTLLFVPSPAMKPAQHAQLFKKTLAAIAAALDGKNKPFPDFYDYASCFKDHD